MELKDIKIKDFPSGEFKDNETLQVYIDRLNEANVNVVTGKLDEMVNWGGRSNSLWPLVLPQVAAALSLWLPLLLITTWHALAWR